MIEIPFCFSLEKKGRARRGGISEYLQGSHLCPSSWALFIFCLWVVMIPSSGFAQYSASYVGISLSELERALGKVSGTISFAPRPGSEQGTLEARLAGNAGLVQAAGSPGNLSVVVLWVPIANGKFAKTRSREYLEALVRLFTNDSDPMVRWTEQVLEHAVTEGASTPYLESQFLDEQQFKATYLPTLSPPMLSLTVTGGEQGTSR